MNRYRLTNQAVQDLSDIWNYSRDAWSEEQADRYYEMLLQTCSNIANQPKSGRSYDRIIQNLYGIHSGRHVIFYRIISIELVEVARILHERMDLKSRLSGGKS